jgi:molecular chaperone HscA
MAAGMARLEVTFAVDADGLLTVRAREATTGIEQRVSVKPTYGLDDATVERMLMDALDHGEEDLQGRRLAEARVEAGRLLAATRRALGADSDLLDGMEVALIDAACLELDAAARADSPARIQAAMGMLDDATKAFAARRMNRARALALGGQRVEVIERTVEHAKGIESAHGPQPEPVG